VKILYIPLLILFCVRIIAILYQDVVLDPNRRGN
jgi:uncharacterized membrane protein YhdT